MTLADAARDLYGLDPAEFVAARDALARETRAAGDRELAADIGRLRRPTVAAWTVNLLTRSTPGELDALLRLGAALRAAQRELSGDQLRALGARRQQAVTALARRAGALAAEAGRPVGEPILREVAQTLTAALADPAVAQQITDGTLTTAVTYDGFGPNEPALAAVAPPVPEEPAATDPDAERAHAARAELDDARSGLESARAARDSAQAAAERAAQESATADDHLTRLRAELADAEQRRRFAKSAEHDARERLRHEQRQLDRAERRLRRARDELDGD
ncbi:hypothetical protein [Nocardia arizonensis]|uniref:hypothetical protein n=1 Tax=Nocardia arizonensis TaxID=1141647 RepID=UPI0006D2A989|nr:hypothetical protein [Nocardia arizonensis]